MTNPICCGQEAQYYEDVTIEGIDAPGYGYYCDVCQNKVAHPDKEEAKNIFIANSTATQEKTPTGKVEKKGTKPSVNAGYNKGAKVSNNNSLTISHAKVLQDRENRFIEICSPIVSGDKGALERLVRNNMRYVENADLGAVWETEEGQRSIIHETEEAMIMGLELGKMGDLVPYGKVCQLIPSIEAYEFALKNGKNAAFKDIRIICIYENDNLKITNNKADGFNYDLEQSFPRGEIAGVLVYAEKKNGMAIGEFYDAERLMAKAEAHSVSYQRYLQDVRAFEAMEAAGELKEKNGRLYFMKTIEYTKDGQKKSFQKETFRDDLKNPYDGADKPEMLRKAAGKSFLAPYMKVRNSEAAMEEVKSSEDAKDRAFSDIIGDVEEVE